VKWGGDGGGGDIFAFKITAFAQEGRGGEGKDILIDFLWSYHVNGKYKHFDKI